MTAGLECFHNANLSRKYGSREWNCWLSVNVDGHLPDWMKLFLNLQLAWRKQCLKSTPMTKAVYKSSLQLGTRLNIHSNHCIHLPRTAMRQNADNHCRANVRISWDNSITIFFPPDLVTHPSFPQLRLSINKKTRVTEGHNARNVPFRRFLLIIILFSLFLSFLMPHLTYV